MNELFQRAKAMEDKFIGFRRQFHRHPEPGWEEFETSATVMHYLEELGIPYTRIGTTAVVGLIEGGLPGEKCIGIRADMDCLPITEKTGVEYVSQIPGRMHACGHDGHTAILMGVATLLSEIKDQIPGKVKLFFQPAEEGPGGAKIMIEAGCMENPKVDAVIALHVATQDLPTGKVAMMPGPSSGGTQGLTIVIKGRGGHGAHPHKSVDAIVAAAQMITALQSIASREVDPLDSIVITIGTIQGGYRGNVIADRVEMTGTIRTLRPNVRNAVPGQIERIVAGVCAAYRCTYEIDIPEGIPSVINDPAMVSIAQEACISVLGKDKVIIKKRPSMGGEDFCYFAQAAPGMMISLGAENAKKDCSFPGHHPNFNIDEDCIAIGMAVLSQTALDFLKK